MLYGVVLSHGAACERYKKNQFWSYFHDSFVMENSVGLAYIQSMSNKFEDVTNLI